MSEKYILEFDKKPALVFVDYGNGKAGDFDLYQNGEEIQGIRNVDIDAGYDQLTTHRVEYLTCATDQGDQKVIKAAQSNPNEARKIIGGGRACGKTPELIKMSHYDSVPILVASIHHKRVVLDKSREMGLKIPDPVTIDELYARPSLRGGALLIDEIEAIFQRLTGTVIKTASISLDLEKL